MQYLVNVHQRKSRILHQFEAMTSQLSVYSLLALVIPVIQLWTFANMAGQNFNPPHRTKLWTIEYSEKNKREDKLYVNK